MTDQRKGLLSRTEIAVLETLYSLGHHMIKNKKSAYLLLTINFLEIIGLLLFRDSKTDLKTHNYILLCLEPFSFDSTIVNLEISWMKPTLLWISFAYTSFLFFLLIIIFATKLKSQAGRKSRTLKIAGQMLIYHQYIFSIPFAEISCLTIMSHLNLSQWQISQDILMATISWLQLFFNILLLFFEIVIVNNFFTAHNYLAKMPSRVNMLVFIFEVWLIISHQLKFLISDQRILVAIMSIEIGYGALVWSSAFYNYTYLRLEIKMYTQGWLAGILYLNCAYILNYFLTLSSQVKEVPFESFILIFGLAFFIKTLHKLQNQYKKKIVLEALLSQKYTPERLNAMLAMTVIFIDHIENYKNANQVHIFEKEISSDDIYFQAIIQNHRKNCRKTSCSCHINQSITQSDFYFYDKSNRMESLLIAGHIFNESLLHEINNNKIKAEVLVLYCLFLVYFFNNYLKSIYFVKQGQALAMSNLTLGENGMMFMINKILSDKIQKDNTLKNHMEILPQFNVMSPLKPNFAYLHEQFQRQRDSLDFEKIISFEREMKVLFDLGMKYSSEQRKIWEIVSYEKSKNLTKLNKILYELEKLNKLMRRSLTKLDKIFEKNYKSYLMYGFLVSFLRNDYQLGKSYFRIASRLINGPILKFVRKALVPDEQETYDVVCVEGLMENNNCHINYITKTSQIIFKTPPEYLKGQKINVLMPKIYSGCHDGFIRNFVETGETKVLNRPFDSFAKNSDSFIFSVKIVSKLSFNIQNGLQLISMITPIDNSNYICLCSDKGTITDVSEKFCSLFKIKPGYFNYYRVNISFFSMEIKKIMSIFDKFYNYSPNKEIFSDSKTSDSKNLKSKSKPDNSYFNKDNSMMASFIMRAETRLEIDNDLKKPSQISNNSIFSQKTVENEDLNGFLEDKEIIQNYESIAGGLVSFKIPKSFIDNQNKKMKEKDREPIQMFKSIKRVDPPKKTSEFTKTTNMTARMLIIKIKLRRLLARVRENMKKASHFVIKARVQIIYLQHNNILIKTFMIKSILSAGWEAHSKEHISALKSYDNHNQKVQLQIPTAMPFKRVRTGAFASLIQSNTSKNNSTKVNKSPSQSFEDVLSPTERDKQDDSSNRSSSSDSTPLSNNKKEGRNKSGFSRFQAQNQENLELNYNQNGSAKQNNIFSFAIHQSENSEKGGSPFKFSKENNLLSFHGSPSKSNEAVLEISNLSKKKKTVEFKTPSTPPLAHQQLSYFGKSIATNKGFENKHLAVVNASNQKIPSPFSHSESDEESDAFLGVAGNENQKLAPLNDNRWKGRERTAHFKRDQEDQSENENKKYKEEIDMISSNKSKKSNSSKSNISLLSKASKKKFMNDYSIDENKSRSGNKKISLIQQVHQKKKITLNQSFKEQDAEENSLQKSNKAPNFDSPGLKKPRFSVIHNNSFNLSERHDTHTINYAGTINLKSFERKSAKKTDLIKSSSNNNQLIKVDINVEKVLENVDDLQSEFTETTKNDKIKSLYYMLSTSFYPRSLKTLMICNRVSFLCLVFLELIIPILSAIFVLNLSEKFGILIEYEKLLHLQALSNVEISLYAYSLDSSLRNDIMADSGIKELNFFLRYESLREKSYYISQIIENLELLDEKQFFEDMIEFKLQIYRTQSQIYKFIYEFNHDIRGPDLSNMIVSDYLLDYHQKIIEILNSLLDSNYNNSIIIYIWAPFTITTTFIILIILVFLLRHALETKIKILKIFFYISNDVVSSQLLKYERFSKTLIVHKLFNYLIY